MIFNIFAVGETVNLMSVDTQRFMDLLQVVAGLWSTPFTVILCQFFLWQQLGVSSFAGLAVIILTIPLNRIMAEKLKDLQERNMKNKDERMKTMNEVLDSIKVLKLYTWESSFAKKIEDSRAVEIKALKKIALLNAMMVFSVSALPFLVAIVSFATFVLSDPNNKLTAQTAFVSLAYYEIMRDPLLQIPSIIVQTVQAKISAERISRFLNQTEIKNDDITHNTDANNAIVVKKCSFSWDPEVPNTIKNISATIPRGALVAVVGRVGSGKSTLLSGLTGEAIKVGSHSIINIDGSVAYMPQEAWIQNKTVRENILFGNKYDATVYNQVIEACTLTEDFKILPAGDMTEIGERGINLSGGQKQRISLARAVYSNRDVYLLDDPLAAVDAPVGKYIFEHVLGPCGLLKKKTRLLVTNSVSVLPKADMIIVMKDGQISAVGCIYKVLYILLLYNS